MLAFAVVCAPFIGQAAPQRKASAEPSLTRGSFVALTDVAQAGNYTAAIGGNALYLFDSEKGGFWQEYTHPQPIVQIAFDGQGSLYFRDAYRNLYTLNATEWTESVTVTDTEIDCGEFFLNGNDLYYASVADGNTLVYAHSTQTSLPLLFSGEYRDFCFEEGGLYALKEDGLFLLDTTSRQATLLTRFSTPRTQLALHGNQIFTTGGGSLYRYDASEGSDAPLTGDDYTALCSAKEGVYALKGGEAYLVTAEGSIAQAEDFSKPHVSAIPAEDLKRQVEEGAEFSVVQTKAQALLIEVDVADTGATLPFVQTLRKAPFTALKIAETKDYALLAYRENLTKDYQNLVVAKNGYEDLGNAYSPDYDKEKIGYATNDISLYQRPHLGLTALSKISRGEEITLLGEVKGLDCEYYKVLYQEKIGYLPKAYVTELNGDAQTPTETIINDRDANADEIWRLAYILLGAAAISILVGFLILRKKKED